MRQAADCISVVMQRQPCDFRFQKCLFHLACQALFCIFQLFTFLYFSTVHFPVFFNCCRCVRGCQTPVFIVTYACLSHSLIAGFLSGHHAAAAPSHIRKRSLAIIWRNLPILGTIMPFKCFLSKLHRSSSSQSCGVMWSNLMETTKFNGWALCGPCDLAAHGIWPIDGQKKPKRSCHWMGI